MLGKMKRSILDIIKPMVLPWNRATLKKFYSGQHSLTEMNKPGAKVLLLAPHVDDETIGAGGTIIRHVQQGDVVTVLFMTDGAKSVSDMPRAQLVAARKEEARKVQGILGFQHMSFFDLPDGEVESTPSVQESLLQLVREIEPDFIYCPTFVDCHSDHIATAEIVADTLVQYEKNCMVRLYEINCPIPPESINVILDISEQLEKKDKAIDVFTSQAIDFDGFQELSRIKTALLGNESGSIEAVETFLEIPSSEYSKEAKRVIEKRRNYNQYFKQINKAITLGVRVQKKSELKRKFYEER